MNKVFRNYNEFISLPFAVLLYFVFPAFYRQFDSSAGAFDAGFLHAIIYAIIVINASSGVAWIMFKWSFPVFYKYFDDDMEPEVLKCEGKISAAVYFSFLIYLMYFISLLIVTCKVLNTI